MSIPTRLHVLLEDGNILYNESLFTISYGQDLRDREVWIERLKETLHDERARKYVSWIDSFVMIETEPYFHHFNRKDLGLDHGIS